MLLQYVCENQNRCLLLHSMIQWAQKRGVIAMNTDKQIRIAIRMKEDEKKEFMDLCKEKCINSSELIRYLIRKWINENKNT